VRRAGCLTLSLLILTPIAGETFYKPMPKKATMPPFLNGKTVFQFTIEKRVQKYSFLKKLRFWKSKICLRSNFLRNQDFAVVLSQASRTKPASYPLFFLSHPSRRLEDTIQELTEPNTAWGTFRLPFTSYYHLPQSATHTNTTRPNSP